MPPPSPWGDAGGALWGVPAPLPCAWGCVGAVGVPPHPTPSPPHCPGGSHRWGMGVVPPPHPPGPALISAFGVGGGRGSPTRPHKARIGLLARGGAQEGPGGAQGGSRPPPQPQSSQEQRARSSEAARASPEAPAEHRKPEVSLWPVPARGGAGALPPWRAAEGGRRGRDGPGRALRGGEGPCGVCVCVWGQLRYRRRPGGHRVWGEGGVGGAPV